MLSSEIKIDNKVNSINLQLRGSLVVIRGNSSTGKSLLVDIIKRQIAKINAVKNASDKLYGNIEIFDYKRTNVNEITSYKNKLIIIDNADELIKA